MYNDYIYYEEEYEDDYWDSLDEEELEDWESWAEHWIDR